MTTAVTRLPIVGVMGSSTQAFEDVAVPLGRCLAGLSVHLLTGGGVAAMEAVSRGFAEVTPRAGKVIGVLPADLPDGVPVPRDGYPNAWVEIVIYTHLPLSGISGTDMRSRNHINVLSSDVVVVLPGGEGTQSEAELAVRYGRPAIAFFGSHTVAWPLPDGVAAARSIEDVAEFVRGQLGRQASRR